MCPLRISTNAKNPINLANPEAVRTNGIIVIQEYKLGGLPLTSTIGGYYFM
jgi:hypothetical protein